MEFIYSVDLNLNRLDDYLKGPDERCISSLSVKNIVALYFKKFVFIIPLEKPNELIEVVETTTECTHLLWSPDGLSLVILQKNGIHYQYSFNVILRI